MPKAERGTPKDIANRMKAKGLQKLKWYCQMCQKQCRDENGFKCHLTSDAHLRQMKFFSENAGGMIDSMSRQFEMVYLDTLRRRHGTSRVNANNVYQEVIQDKHHIHMNATKWTTLTDFCRYLGKTSKCVVEETERGWYVTYIERDAKILERQRRQQLRAEADKLEEERVQKTMEIQRIEAAKALDRAGGTVHTVASNIEKGAIKDINISLSKTSNKKKTAVKESVFVEDDDEEKEEEEVPAMGSKQTDKPGQKRSRWTTSKDNYGRDSKVPKTDKVAKGSSSNRSKESNQRDGSNVREREENWLHRDILVRIISKKLAHGKYYKRKGVVDKVIDKFTAEVEVLDSDADHRDGGDILRLDQDDLETVIPKEGKSVRILNGRGRGKRAKVVSVNKKKYVATLRINDDVLEGVDFDDFSKLA